MNERTTDLVKLATKRFFDNQGLTTVVDEYFSSACVQKKLDEGYEKYQYVLTEAKRTAPEGVEEFAEEVAEKLSMSEAAYKQKVFETFKDKLADIMIPVVAFIPIRELLENLLKDHENENLLLLVMSAMDDILDFMTNRFANIVALLTEGFPMELAEKLADEAGDSQIIPIGVKVCRVKDDEGESGEDEHDCCGGECGGHCNCGEKDGCKRDGHCQCEDGCKCGKDADK